MSHTRHRIGEAEALEERGLALRFERSLSESGFVIRVDGQFKAYVNRCPHRGTELDWAPGEVFDADRAFLVCATHGALFAPDTGRCVSGPCRGAQLESIAVIEENGILYWSEEHD